MQMGRCRRHPPTEGSEATTRLGPMTPPSRMTATPPHLNGEECSLERAVEDRLQRLRAVSARRRREAGFRDPLALGVLPVAAVEEPFGCQGASVDVVQAAGIDADAVRIGARDVEGVHPAVRAERMLRDAGAEGVGLERGLALQQLEGG